MFHHVSMALHAFMAPFATSATAATLIKAFLGTSGHATGQLSLN